MVFFCSCKGKTSDNSTFISETSPESSVSDNVQYPEAEQTTDDDSLVYSTQETEEQPVLTENSQKETSESERTTAVSKEEKVSSAVTVSDKATTGETKTAAVTTRSRATAATTLVSKTTRETTAHTVSKSSTTAPERITRESGGVDFGGTSAGTTKTTRSSDTTKTEKQEKTVRVKIICKTAVDYGFTGKNVALPSNGIIADCTVKYTEGMSALDALKAAASSEGIKVDESHGYVKGIAGLYEKDCGGSSGWLYSVNDEFPNTSSDKYKLQENDVVTFIYTVKMGDVTYF